MILKSFLQDSGGKEIALSLLKRFKKSAMKGGLDEECNSGEW
jgi:hypothetical protein